MADDEDHHDSREILSDPTIKTSRSGRCCNIPVSPYPMYIANVLYFMPVVINNVVSNAIIYNKLCFNKYQNISLCTNSTFTKNHAELQVSEK